MINKRTEEIVYIYVNLEDKALEEDGKEPLERLMKNQKRILCY